MPVTHQLDDFAFRLVRLPVALALMALFAAVLSGCRGNDNNRQLIHREMRWLEDDIYHLEDELREYQRRLESCRRENDALRAELNGTSRDDDVQLTPPRITLPELPNIEPPRGDSAPPFEPAPSTRSHSTQSRRVTQIRLNRRLTGGFDGDDQPGDEGVMVVLEPRNAAGQLVEAGGAVTLFVNDPALEPASRTVARWSFTPEEVAARFRETPMGDGVHFRLPWPNRPPRHESLELLVRYDLPGGRQLMAERPFQVELPSTAATAQWESRRQRNATTGPLGRLSDRQDHSKTSQLAETGWSKSTSRPEDIDLLIRRRAARNDAWNSSPTPDETSPIVPAPADDRSAEVHLQTAAEMPLEEIEDTASKSPRWRPFR